MCVHVCESVYGERVVANRSSSLPGLQAILHGTGIQTRAWQAFLPPEPPLQMFLRVLTWVPPEANPGSQMSVR